METFAQSGRGKNMWIATVDKILALGDEWRDNMVIVETADAVLGHNDPGGVPLADVAALATSSARAFGEVIHNLEFIRQHMVFNDTTIIVSDATTYAAAQAYLENTMFVRDGKTLEISFTVAGDYLGALVIDGIHGGGTVLVSCVAGVVVKAAGPCIDVQNNTAYINFDDTITAENTALPAAYIARVSYCTHVKFDDLQLLNSTDFATSSGDGLYIANSSVRLNFSVNNSSPTGVLSQGLFVTERSNVYIPAGGCDFGRMPEYMDIRQGSTVTVERYSEIFDTPTDVQDLTARGGIFLDESSRLRANNLSGSGTGTEADPFVITISGVTANDSILIQAIIDNLPRPLNQWLKIKLPAGTLMVPIFFEDLQGTGGVLIEANTVKVARGITQDTLINTTAATNHPIAVRDCQLTIKVHSLSLYAENGNALNVEERGSIIAEFCRLRAPTGAGAFDNIGNAAYCKGYNSYIKVFDTMVGDCDEHGFHATDGGRVTAIYCNEEGVTPGVDSPTHYGNYAYNGGFTQYDDGHADNSVLGGDGVAGEAKAGLVHGS